MSLLANSNAMTAQGGGYTISNSLRFQSASSQYLSRTFATPTSATTWTWSSWIKRGSVSAAYPILSNSTGTDAIYYSSSNTIDIWRSSATVATSTAVYRDPASWYHLVFVSNGTTVKGYVNNSEVVSYTGSFTSLGTATSHYIGRTGSAYADGYMAEVNFIDGQALTPSSFGISDPYTGQWEAKKYTGTYGTNGFYLPFSNGTSTVTLGVDYSGNNNNWALNAFTRSAGVSDCWMKDVPSGNGFGGVNASSNYAVMNRLKIYTANFAITNANLTASDSSTGNVTGVSTLSTGTSGKYYFECTMTAVASSSAGSGSNVVGVAPESSVNANSPFLAVGSYRSGNPIYNLAGVAQTAGATYTTGDVIGVAVDVSAGTVQFYKNNVAQGATPSFTFTAGTELWPFVAGDNVAGTKTYNLNFGQRSFAYTPPTGFLPLCTANLPSPTIWQSNKYMDATAYSGNGTGQSITNSGSMQPDLLWIKCRTSTSFHVWVDSVRGLPKVLSSNSTDAEGANGYVTSLNSNGFTLPANVTSDAYYTNVGSPANTFVGWQWQAGKGTTSTNTQGSITSTVSVNTLSGFSIVTFTAPASGSFTVGHGLGIAPKMIIVKDRANATSWPVYHSSVCDTSSRYLYLNTTGALSTSTSMFGTALPTSTVFGATSNTTIVASASAVAYCFAEIAGFSKFGSYTGNGSADGPFVYLGFRPKFIMIKRSDSTSNWFMYDTSRSPYNVGNQTLAADSAIAESSYAATNYFDFVSNGFKVRQDNTSGYNNANGGTYIYMAFAESPFNFSNAR